MTAHTSQDEPLSIAGEVLGLLVVLGGIALTGLLFWVLHWPLLVGAAIATFALFALFGTVGISSAREPLVILGNLPDELRGPLEPFIRRGTQTLTVSEIRKFYRAAGELMEDRADLARHQAELINAGSALQLATAMAEFVNSLSHEDRALLEYRRRDR